MTILMMTLTTDTKNKIRRGKILKTTIKTALLFATALTIGFFHQSPVQASSFKANFQRQIVDLSGPEITLKSQKNEILVVKVANGFHPSSEPESYAYWTLHAIKHSKGWRKFTTVQMEIHGYYDDANGHTNHDENTKTWTINTQKLAHINLSEKAVDQDGDSTASTDEVRDFADTLPSLMDSIQ